MTNKQQLQKYLTALGFLSTDIQKQIVKTISEEAEKEPGEDFGTLLAKVISLSPILRKQFRKQVGDFLKTWDIKAILEGCASDIGHPMQEIDRVVETIENGLKGLPIAGTKQLEELTREILRKKNDFKDWQIEEALERFADKSIPTVIYKDGKTVSVEQYARMAANTGLHSAQLEAEAEERVQRRSFLVFAAPRSEACAKCIPWLGVVMFDDMHFLGNIPPAYQHYPKLSDAVKRGFLHPNCRDTVREYDPMSSEVERPTKEQQEEILKRYEKEQEIHNIKKNIRKYKIMEGTGEEKYTKLKKRWEERLKEAEGK